MSENERQQQRAELEAKVVELYRQDKLPVAQIASEIGLSENTVYVILRARGVKPSRQGNFKFVRPEDNQEQRDKILDMLQRNVPKARIAELTGTSREWVYTIAERAGLHQKGEERVSALPPALQRALERAQLNFSQWRKQYDFPASLAYDVINGRRKAQRGTSRRIKEQLVLDFPDLAGLFAAPPEEGRREA